MTSYVLVCTDMLLVMYSRGVFVKIVLKKIQQANSHHAFTVINFHLCKVAFNVIQ